VFRLEDARRLGLEKKVASDRARSGRLFRLHVGVYSIVPPELLRIEGHWLAAVFACGPGAVLSHACAAALWGFWRVPSGSVHVTIPASSGRRRPGIAIHRSLTLAPDQVTVRRRVPVTTVPRTLADMKRALPPRLHAAAVRRAEIARLDTGEDGDEPDSLSRFERRLVALCRRRRLPLPAGQQIIGPYTVDFLWPDARLVVEMDDYRTHGVRSAFESDRERDAWLVANGYRVIRLTWRQLTFDPARVARTLRQALGLGD
jgi:very-short-patch-repair endonuclease